MYILLTLVYIHPLLVEKYSMLRGGVGHKKKMSRRGVIQMEWLVIKDFAYIVNDKVTLHEEVLQKHEKCAS